MPGSINTSCLVIVLKSSTVYRPACESVICAPNRILSYTGFPRKAPPLAALHNWGCSWGLNPPVSRSARVM